jgi:hypothetical protein
MQVLLFAGSSYYPRSHAQDLVGTLSRLPTTDEVAAWVRQFMESDERFDLSTSTIDWVTALNVGAVPGQLRRMAWKCMHVNDPVRMRREAYSHIWQDSDGEWHAVKQVEAADLDELRMDALTWPVGS